jgi:Bacteriophage HK97-gp10, putative tail-component
LAEIRGALSLNINVIGLAELQSQFNRLGKMPKKSLTKAAKAGMKQPLADARANAQKYTQTGTMQKSIKAKMETPNKRKKTVYRINWDSKYSPIFIKTAKRPGLYGGKSPAYYPQSVEWGHKTKYGRVAGKYFVRDAIESNQQSSLQKITDILNDEITELLR